MLLLQCTRAKYHSTSPCCNNISQIQPQIEEFLSLSRSTVELIPRVPQSPVRFYRVLQGFTGFHRVISGPARFIRVFQGFNGSFRVLQNLTESHKVINGSSRFYRL